MNQSVKFWSCSSVWLSWCLYTSRSGSGYKSKDWSGDWFGYAESRSLSGSGKDSLTTSESLECDSSKLGEER